jgi:hypothetical protein
MGNTSTPSIDAITVESIEGLPNERFYVSLEGQIAPKYPELSQLLHFQGQMK